MALSNTSRDLLLAVYQTSENPEAYRLLSPLHDSLMEDGSPWAAIVRFAETCENHAAFLMQVSRVRPILKASYTGRPHLSVVGRIIVPRSTPPADPYLYRGPVYVVRTYRAILNGKEISWRNLPDDVLLLIAINRMSLIVDYVRRFIIKEPGRRLASQWTHRSRPQMTIVREAMKLSKYDLCRMLYFLNTEQQRIFQKRLKEHEELLQHPLNPSQGGGGGVRSDQPGDHPGNNPLRS